MTRACVTCALTLRVQLGETCLSCHKGWTEEQTRYALDSVKAHIKGKMRKAMEAKRTASR